MSEAKKIVNGEISIETSGREFVGRRSIEGTRKLLQTIHYGTESKHDGHAYRPGEEAQMDSIARSILRELVQEAGDCPV